MENVLRAHIFRIIRITLTLIAFHLIFLFLLFHSFNDFLEKQLLLYEPLHYPTAYMIQGQTQKFIIALIANPQPLGMRILRPGMVPLPRTNAATTIPHPAEGALTRSILLIAILLPTQLALL